MLLIYVNTAQSASPMSAGPNTGIFVTNDNFKWKLAATSSFVAVFFDRYRADSTGGLGDFSHYKRSTYSD